jgi:bifunctional non-homologous end joining protein LigD
MAQYPAVQLATLVDQAPSGEQWVHELKFDGYRLLGFVVDGEVRLRTRNGHDWTGSFPAIAAALGKLKAKEAVLDLEAVMLDADGKPSFQALQAALGDGGQPELIVAYAFDLLHLDGENLTKQKLIERKRKLEALLRKSKPAASLRYSEHLEVEGTVIHAQACEKGLEGIISKLAGAPYVAGRQKSWVKVKCALRQEFIIVGYSAPKSGDRALGALYLGYRKDGALRYAGKVGTGFTIKSARELVGRFDAISAAKPVLTRKQRRGWALMNGARFTGSSPSCFAGSRSPNGRMTAVSAIRRFRDCARTRMPPTSSRRSRHPSRFQRFPPSMPNRARLSRPASRSAIRIG